MSIKPLLALSKHRSIARDAFYSTLLVSLCALGTASCTRFDPPPIAHVVQDQAERYTQMQVPDWYKLLHQAAMGSRHLGADSSAIYGYLLSEWESIEASNDEPLVEYISPDSDVVRLNLRPYKARSGTPADVYRMMAVSWHALEPSTDRLEDYLAQLVFMAERGDVGLDPDALAAFIGEQRAGGYPAVHHSDAYEQAYRPAYRVVLRETLMNKRNIQ